MITDMLMMSSPDMILASASGASDMVMHNAGQAADQILLASDQGIKIGGGNSNAPKLNITVDDGIKKFIRIISIALALAWALFFIWNVGKPGGSRQAVQKMGGPVGIIAALTAIVAGLDIQLALDVVDKLLQIGYFVLSFFKDNFG